MTSLRSSTLRPGYLVSLKTSITGNVNYDKTTIESAHRTKGGAIQEKWETLKTVSDPKEHEDAVKARGRISSLIRGVCSKSSFGLLCPENEIETLEERHNQARLIKEEFNRTAKLTRIEFYVLTGRIAPDDVEAVRAINSEVRELLDEMKSGIKALDADAVRDACNKARNLAQMISPEAAGRIQAAIDAARKVARVISKSGDQAALDIDKALVRRITQARTEFLDLEDAREIATPQAQGRALDLSPDSEIKALAEQSRNIEL